MVYKWTKHELCGHNIRVVYGQWQQGVAQGNVRSTLRTAVQDCATHQCSMGPRVLLMGP